MSRYIDADEFMARCYQELKECEGEDFKEGIRWMMVDVVELQTVDVVPVKHGHWIKIGNQDSIRNMKCSICGEEVFGDVDTEKYCFNCGAKMDEVKK